MKKCVFIIFDYDKDLPGQLVRHTKQQAAQFAIVDQSLKHGVEGNWKKFESGFAEQTWLS